MCWSFGASAVFAIAEISASVWCWRNKEHHCFAQFALYFGLMEALQATTYFFLDDCGNSINQILTALGYFHICFQPLIINRIALHCTGWVRDKLWIHDIVYFICGACSFYMLLQFYPFDWAGDCDAPRKLCGTDLCARYGTWHLAWHMPLNDFGLIYAGYVLPSFILPWFYGAWKLSIYLYIAGPMLANLLSDNPKKFLRFGA